MSAEKIPHFLVRNRKRLPCARGWVGLRKISPGTYEYRGLPIIRLGRKDWYVNRYGSMLMGTTFPSLAQAVAEADWFTSTSRTAA